MNIDWTKYDTTEKLLDFIDKHFTLEPMVWDMIKDMPYSQLLTYTQVKIDKLKNGK